MHNKPLRVAAAVLSAAVLTLAGAGSAIADVGDPYSVGTVNQEAANTALINPLGDVQLSIHKHLGTLATPLPNNGTAQSVSLPTLSGVKFDVYIVEYQKPDGTWAKVDLTTNAGWTAAASLQGVSFASGTATVGSVNYRITAVSTVTTVDGVAVFTAVDGVGLYYVAENLSTSGTITDSTGATIPKSAITPASPFLVTLPMTNPDTKNRWMYDVNVYPKNQADSITKAVNDETTYTVGKAIQYTLNSTISTIKPLGYYQITDNNPYITATAITVSIVGTSTTSLNACNGATGTGTSPCDYYYWLDKDAAAAGSQMQVEFTAAGLAKLEAAKAADPSAQVKTVIDGTILSVPASGVVPNQASFIPNSAWYAANGGTTPLTPPATTPPGTPVTPNTPNTPNTPTTPGIPSNEVKSYFGTIPVTKNLVGAASGDTAAGATFALYVDPTPTTGCTTADVTGTALMTATVPVDGTGVTFTDLRASNWADNVALADNTKTGWIQYCIVETVAPAGYNLNAEAVAVTIDWATGTSTLTREAPVTINDEKSNLGNNLPLTGGAGVAAVSGLGLLLVGGGVAYFLLGARRRREEMDV